MQAKKRQPFLVRLRESAKSSVSKKATSESLSGKENYYNLSALNQEGVYAEEDQL